MPLQKTGIVNSSHMPELEAFHPLQADARTEGGGQVTREGSELTGWYETLANHKARLLRGFSPTLLSVNDLCETQIEETSIRATEGPSATGGAFG